MTPTHTRHFPQHPPLSSLPFHPPPQHLLQRTRNASYRSFPGNGPGTGTVSVPGGAFFTDFVVIPGDFMTLEVPRHYRTTPLRIFETTRQARLSIYSLNEGPFTSGGAFLCLPTNILDTNIQFVFCVPDALVKCYSIMASSH